MTADRRIRWVFKPLVHAACAAPLAVVAWWAFTGGLGANPIEALIRELGDWALRLLLVSLAVTPLRQMTGWNALIRFRRMLGLWAFAYVCLHLSAYIGLDHFFNWPVIWADIVKRIYITVGMAAVLMLIPLAVTSTKGWIRRLGKRWQPLHRLVYLAAIAGVLHFYLMVKADTREPLIYAAILAVLLGWRAVGAIRRRAARRQPAGVRTA